MDKSNFNLKKKELELLLESEQEIKKKIKNNITFNEKYERFALLDYFWYKKYKAYLNDLIIGKAKKIFTYNYKNIHVKLEKKIYCFGKEKRDFNFFSNFVLVTEKLINIFSKNFKDYKDMNRPILIGGQCMIIRDKKHPTDIYITYYEENKNNNIDFWLMIKDEKQRIKHLNIILNNNLWYYLELINFNFLDCNKKDIYDDNGKSIGHFIINCDSALSQFLNSMAFSYINQNLQQYQILKKNNKIIIEQIPKIYSILVC